MKRWKGSLQTLAEVDALLANSLLNNLICFVAVNAQTRSLFIQRVLER